MPRLNIYNTPLAARRFRPTAERDNFETKAAARAEDVIRLQMLTRQRRVAPKEQHRRLDRIIARLRKGLRS